MNYALVAPQPLIISTALHDPVENTWGIERVFEKVQAVYQLLGQGANIGLRYRPEPHAADEAITQPSMNFCCAPSSGRALPSYFPTSPIIRATMKRAAARLHRSPEGQNSLCASSRNEF
jgi:hypothetical protein